MGHPVLGCTETHGDRISTWTPRAGLMPTLSSLVALPFLWKPVVPSSWRRISFTLLGHLRGESTDYLRRIALKLSLLLGWTSSSTNNGFSGDLRRKALPSIFFVVPILSYMLPISPWSVPLFCINIDDFSVWPTGSEKTWLSCTIEVIDCPQAGWMLETISSWNNTANINQSGKLGAVSI